MPVPWMRHGWYSPILFGASQNPLPQLEAEIAASPKKAQSFRWEFGGASLNVQVFFNWIFGWRSWRFEHQLRKKTKLVVCKCFSFSKGGTFRFHVSFQKKLGVYIGPCFQEGCRSWRSEVTPCGVFVGQMRATKPF